MAVWTQDEANPYPTRPYPGQSWAEQGRPKQQPHKYIRNGTAKLLILFCPGSGEVRSKGVTHATNAVMIPLDNPRLMTLLVTRDGKVPTQLPHLNLDCAATSGQAWAVFSRIARLPETAFGGTQLLADHAGWLRARSAGKAAWSDADLLCKSGQPGAGSRSPTKQGLAAVLGRMDAEPVRFVKGCFVH